jgi:AraC-like DNA-binding protein
MNRWLTSLETKRALQALGIERPFAATFGALDRAEDRRYNFHRHRQHQLLFPVSGLLFIETKSNFYVLSPQIALWIPAELSHATTTMSAQTLSAFLSPAEFGGISEIPTMVRVTPLLHQAMKHTVEHQDAECTYTAALFQVIHGAASENILEGSWPTLPVGSSEALKRTIDAIMQELDSITVRGLAVSTGQSERTMRRRFLKELGMGPELFIQRARLIRAMQLLMANRGESITEIGLEAGYSNHSAFTSAFRKLTGLTPTAFRKGASPA